MAYARCYKLTKAWALKNNATLALSSDDLARVHNGTSKYQGMPEAAFANVLKSLKVPQAAPAP
jgi:hypothetical protein